MKLPKTPVRFLLLCLVLALVFLIGSWRESNPQTRAAEPQKPNADSKVEPKPVDFGREIRPLLAKRCFHCHGPDKAESSLRLNSQESAFAETDSGMYAIVPGKPGESELIARISETDESLRMPPEGKPLSPEQIQTMKRWIASGAKWETHWAFQPMQNPAPPQVKNKSWPANPIDAFILHRLELNGLKPRRPPIKWRWFAGSITT